MSAGGPLWEANGTMGLNDAQVQQYADAGYLVLEGLIPAERLARYRRIFDELVERSRSLTESRDGFNLAPDEQGRPIPGRLHKLQGVCVTDERVLELAREPELLDRVESLIGPNIDMFGTKFYPMLVRGATSTGWHQDNHYFGTASDRVVSCAIYLEETGPENGCLQVVPGSHRAGRLVAHTAGTGIYSHGAWTEVDEREAVDIVCPAGTVVLFSANLLHGARPNCSGRSSYRTAWHYIPGDLDLAHFPRGGYKDRHILRGR
jgi:ectoine hydroxylase-related dioxygenase (phytanoyl-CoA dioxygenase family)